MKPEHAESFLPAAHARLMARQGMTPEHAFDVLARRAATPAFRAMIQECESTPEGRTLLAQVRAAWDAAGFPCPWDNVLELG